MADKIDKILEELKDFRKENRDDHGAIHGRVNEHAERLTVLETKQKTIWGIIMGIGSAICMTIVAMFAGLFKLNK